MMTKRNICITINSLVNGGAEKQCLLLARALQKHHNAIVIVIKPLPVFPQYMKEIQKHSIPIKVLKGNWIKRMANFISFLKTNQVDIIFSYLPTDTVFAAIGGKLAGVKYMIGGVRSAKLPYHKIGVLRFFHNRIANYSILNSFMAYKFFASKGFKKKAMIMIPNGIVIDTLPIARPAKDEIIIASLSRFVKEKDYETALKSIAYLKDKFRLEKKVKYRIIGHGPYQEILSGWIKNYGLSGQVEIIVKPENPMELLKQSDIFLSTSIFEGLSNSIMEAMSFSLPVIATKVGDNERLIKHGQNGFIVELKDDKSIAKYLHKLIHSPEERNRMGENGYYHLTANYSYKQFKKEYLKLVAHIDQIQIEEGIYSTIHKLESSSWS